MERKFIGKENLANMFAKDEIEAATLLRDALKDVKEKVGEITDPNIKKYNATENEYLFDISLTTIKNYSEKYGYGVFNVVGDGCVVKQFFVSDYQKIKKILDNENKENTTLDIRQSIPEILASNFISKSSDFKEQKMLSIRCSTNQQNRLDGLHAKYNMFTKQFLLSLVLALGLDSVGFYPEKNDEEK